MSACTSAEDLVPAALSIARDIATKSPSAVRAAKTSFGLTGSPSLEEGYSFEQSQTVACARSVIATLVKWPIATVSAARLVSLSADGRVCDGEN